MELLYQDCDIVVAIKPIGAQSEDGKPSAMPALLRQALNLAPTAPIFTVHRLDQQVSGVMVYAKTKAAAANLSAQMQAHQFTKEYRAVVAGIIPHEMPQNPQNTLENVPRETMCAQAEQVPTGPTLPHGRWVDLLYHDKRKNKVFPVKKERKGVKQAILRYTVLAECAAIDSVPPQGKADFPQSKLSMPQSEIDLQHTLRDISTAPNANTLATAEYFSLLQIQLETGRTHQIRVQCASRKLPLLGDTRYGSKIKGCDIALFSHQLSFTHPSTKERLTFTKELPNTYPWSLF